MSNQSQFNNIVLENITGTKGTQGTNVSHTFDLSSIFIGCAATLGSVTLIVIAVVVVFRVWKKWKARRERLRILRERQNVRFWRRSSLYSDDDSAAAVTVSTSFQSSSFSHSTLNMYSYIDENEVSNYLVPVPLAVESIDAVQALNNYENPPPSSFF